MCLGPNQAILDLREGDVRPVMITGDNAHCGHYIAKNCGMLDPDSTVLLSEVVNGQVELTITCPC